MELFYGRPDYDGDRPPRENRVYDFLDRLKISYQRTDHERADHMTACHEIESVLGVSICKNLFLCNRQETVFYLLMMPGSKKFKTKELSSQIGSARLSFAGAEQMLRILDTEPGSVSVLGLMNDQGREVHLLIDQDLLCEEFIGCHPCMCTTSLKIRTKDILDIFLRETGHTYQTVVLKGED